MRCIDPDELDEVVEAVGDWSGLDGARLLLTGATGFYGAWLLATLDRAIATRNLKAEAVVVTRNVLAAREKFLWLYDARWLSFVETDVRALEGLGGSFTHVVHAATSTTLPRGAREDALETASVVVAGTERVLRACVEQGVSRMLYASSGAVYGPQPEGVSHLGEDHRSAPECGDGREVYGHAKRLAEGLCAWCAEESGGALSVVVARGFSFVGPYLPLEAHFAIGNFLSDGLSGRSVVVRGDGLSRRSYLYAGDMAAWLWAALMRGGAGRAYNIGSDEDLSIAEVAARVAKRFGVGVEVRGETGPGEPRRRYVPSVERAKRELGVRVRVSLDEAIERTARWHERG